METAMHECRYRKTRAPSKHDKRAWRGMALAASLLVVLGFTHSEARAQPTLQSGQVWSGDYRCLNAPGRATLEIAKVGPLADRPGRYQLSAKTTLIEGDRWDRRGVIDMSGGLDYPDPKKWRRMVQPHTVA